MGLVISGLVLAALTGCIVWWVTDRFWHGLVIVVLAIALFPMVAGSLTGDVSGYLPAGTFAEGANGKDQIVFASAVATILIAVVLAACIWTSRPPRGGACGANEWHQRYHCLGAFWAPGFVV